MNKKERFEKIRGISAQSDLEALLKSESAKAKFAKRRDSSVAQVLVFLRNNCSISVLFAQISLLPVFQF